MICVFTGHMIDTPDRAKPRYPNWLAPYVHQAILERLEHWKPMCGYAPAACGGDIQFLESCQSMDIDMRILLPFLREDFIDTSVSFAGKEWVTRYNALLDNHPYEEITTEPFLGEDILYSHGFDVLLGSAYKMSQRLNTELCILTVVDLKSEFKTGGTIEVLERWKDIGVHIDIIDIAQLRTKFADLGNHPMNAAHKAGQIPISTSNLILSRDSEREICTMLFADVVGFSKIGEAQSPKFFMHFLKHIADLIEESNQAPTFVNTWGDGLFIVFSDTSDAANFALKLRDSIEKRDWSEVGLPVNFTVRIGMHTGPVFKAWDPVIKQFNFFGSHVNRAARVEPVTEAGEVYCTEASSALLASKHVYGITTDFVGDRYLAKGFDHVPLFRVSRGEDS